jgi:hypothetical protein
MKSKGRRVERRKEERKAAKLSAAELKKQRDLARSIAGKKPKL